MKSHEIDGSREREVLTGMVVNSSVCGAIAARWDGRLFASAAANIVGGMCVRYWRRHRRHPGKDIESLYRLWEEKGQDRDHAEYLSDFLASLSGEYERNGDINPGHVIDVAGELFDDVRLDRCADEIKMHRANGDRVAAEAARVNATPIAVGVGSSISLFTDPEAIRSTYDQEHREPLIEYEGALGEFFADSLSRDSLVGLMAVEKAGKSWWMLDMAYRAMQNRKRVAYFQVGDLSDWQIKDRFLVRAKRHPSRSTREDREWPCHVNWPTSITAPPRTDDDGKVRRKLEPATVTTKRKEFQAPLQCGEDWIQEIMDTVRGEVRSKKSWLELSCHPTRSISVAGIRAVLDGWLLQSDPYVPDVICIDYADILAPVDRKKDEIHQIKETWEELRKLSMEKHCLVITATQVNAASYTRSLLDRSNFSGNHLKYAEVNSMFGINVTSAEKDVGVCRLNCIARREGAFNWSRAIHVAGCLALSCPAVRSCW